MTLRFTDKYCDVLCFISPRVLSEKYENFDVLKTINTINWCIKSSGRFYIDDYNDIVYSLRLGYDILETMPDIFLAELETSIQYYEDLFVLILEVSSGKKHIVNAKNSQMKFDCLGEGISIRFQPENISSDEKTKKLRSDIAQIVCSYEEKSKTVCENCGQTGNMRMDMPWKRTLCDDCYENYLQKIKAKK